MGLLLPEVAIFLPVTLTTINLARQLDWYLHVFAADTFLA
jgi:hypothetical protein